MGGLYAWKSILKGRDVILRGAKWRVGNRETIRLWGGKWLAFVNSPSVQGPLTADFQEASVSTLINLVTRQWDMGLLHSRFSEVKTELIQKLPLSQINALDIPIWPFVQSGEYTVTSGYFFLKTEAKTAPSGNQSNAEKLKPLWKKIWNLPVPCKFQNFLWRACQNVIPTMKNMNRRYMVDNLIYSLCSQHDGDVLHFLWSFSSLT